MIKNQERPATRLQWIDYAKGIGIILVVYGHVLRGLNALGIVEKSYFFYSDTLVYSFHMPLFFVLSGILFTKSFQRYPSTFLSKKVVTLLYPFVIWSIIQVSINILMSKYTNSQISVSDLLSCLVIPRAQFWFLYALFFIHCITYFILKIASNYGLIASIALWAVTLFFHFFTVPYTYVFQYLIFFNVGITLSVFEKQLSKLVKGRYWLALLCIFGVAEYLVFTNNQVNFYKTNLLFAITGTIGSLLVLQLSNKTPHFKLFNFLGILGKASIAIYLMHIIVASGTRIILFNIFHIDNLLLHVVMATTLGIIVPVYVFSYCTKSKYFYWLFNFNAKLVPN